MSKFWGAVREGGIHFLLHLSLYKWSHMADNRRVVLGCPGELATDAEPSIYATRVGGIASYPAAAGPPSPDLTQCRVCSKQMSLMIQVIQSNLFSGSPKSVSVCT